MLIVRRGARRLAIRDFTDCAGSAPVRICTNCVETLVLRESRRDRCGVMTMGQKIRVWDLPVRLFHWLLAGSFVVAYSIAESESLRIVHVILGYTAVGLILFRIIWGFVGSRYARFASFAFAPRAAIRFSAHR